MPAHAATDRPTRCSGTDSDGLLSHPPQATLPRETCQPAHYPLTAASPLLWKSNSSQEFHGRWLAPMAPSKRAASLSSLEYLCPLPTDTDVAITGGARDGVFVAP